MGSLKAVYQWVLRTMMKSKGETGIVQTMPKKDLVELNTQITAQRLMQNGIDPTAFKNADQVENVIKRLESRPTTEEVASTSEAKVFNIKGDELDPNKPIIGGTQPGKKIDTDTFIRLAERNPELVKQRIADKKIKKDEDSSAIEAMIKARLDKDNKEGIARIRKKQKMVDDAIDNMSPSLSGDTRTDAELVAEDLAERMGLVYDDLPTKQRLDLYDQAYTGLSKQRYKGMKKPKDADDQESSYDDGPADFDPDADNETFAQGGRAGFFLGSANPRGLGLLRKILNYMSKTGKEQDKFKGADLSGLDMLRLSNPKRFNRLLEDVRGKVNIKEGIMGTDTVRAMQQAERKKRKDLAEKSLDVAKAIKADDDKIKTRLAKEAETTIIPQVKKQLMEGMGMSEEAAEKAARDMAEAAQNMRPLNAPPEITEEGILQLENVLKNLETAGKKKRDLNADGGRIGFKDGMTRRTFLKIFGGLVSLPIVGKVLAPLKLTRGVSKVPIIKTDNVPGKPEWFDQLVNKVIIEGDDVTKKFATGERQSIHQKTLDDGSVVRVTEDVDDGAVRVEYESEQNVFGDPVQLEYKKPLPDEGAPDPKAEFTTAESGPVGRAYGPDDYEIEVDEVGGTSIRDLDSDVSKLKEYATGKGPTMKEFVQNKRRRDKAAAITDDPAARSDAVVRRQGEMDSSDYETLGTGDDFASGGIARMLGE
jgi:hypothetical protein